MLQEERLAMRGGAVEQAIRDLWSREDEAGVESLLLCVAADDLAGALFAVEGAPERRQRRCLAELDRFTEELAGYRAEDAFEAAALLGAVLGSAYRFTGDADQYHATENSHLTRVVERRRGMPILLSSVWMLCGRAAGMEVEGIPMPGHFIARVGGPGGVLVDPFSGGEPISEETCRAVIRLATGGALDLDVSEIEPADVSSTVERVLRNLCNSHRMARSYDELYRSMRRLHALLPEDRDLALQLAVFTEALGADEEARGRYQALVAPVTDEVTEAARERLGMLQRRVRVFN